MITLDLITKSLDDWNIVYHTLDIANYHNIWYILYIETFVQLLVHCIIIRKTLFLKIFYIWKIVWPESAVQKDFHRNLYCGKKMWMINFEQTRVKRIYLSFQIESINFYVRKSNSLFHAFITLLDVHPSFIFLLFRSEGSQDLTLSVRGTVITETRMIVFV